MPDQAETLRRWVLQSAPPARAVRHGALVLLYGAEMAVGTSALTLQLALAWRRRREAAAVVEIRRHAAPSSTYGPLPARATLRDVARQERTLREAWLTGPRGLPIVAGDLADEPLFPEHPLAVQLQQAAEQQQILVDVQDLADLRTLLPAADHCVFVSSAETEMLTATYRAIKAIATDVCGARCWLAMSQVTDEPAALERQTRVVTTCDRCLNLALGPLGCLPWDPALAVGGDGDLAASSGLVTAAYRQSIEQMCARIEAARDPRACSNAKRVAA